MKIKSRNETVDALKGIAIIAVVLYHLGLLDCGYLGVDAFFVVSGYFTFRKFSTILSSESDEVSGRTRKVLDFLVQRINRLYPLIIAVCVFVLLTGFFVMLPDDYESLCEAVFATIFGANNILSRITVKDYWAISNEFKPLMHTWYLGVLTQFYIMVSFIAIIHIVLLREKYKQKYFRDIWTLLTILSFVFWVLPIGTNESKFYSTFYRFWEFGSSIVLADVYGKLKPKIVKIVSWIAILFSMYCIGGINNKVGVTLTVLSSIGIIETCHDEKSNRAIINMANKILAHFGIMSYSIYIWHEALIVFYRYSITHTFRLFDFAILLVLCSLVGLISYIIFENKFFDKHTVSLLVTAGVIACLGLVGYLHAGVVRSVPELDIDFRSAVRGMNATYNDRIYQYDHEFEHNNKINVLIIGNSFARDFANCLLESSYGDSANISYNLHLDDVRQRVAEADYIFIFGEKEVVSGNFEPLAVTFDKPIWLESTMKSSAELWGIGNKNFGDNNGVVYAKRKDSEYYKTEVEIRPCFVKQNELDKKYWKEHFVNFLDPVLDNTRSAVKVFTPTNRFISQDGYHLTRDGAIYYASVIDWNYIFRNSGGLVK